MKKFRPRIARLKVRFVSFAKSCLRNTDRLIVYVCIVGLAYTFVADDPERKVVLTQEEAEAAQIVELRDQVNQLSQQIKLTTAKLERAPQSCGVHEWLKYDGRRM